MSKTKTKGDKPKKLPLNCHQYKQLMIALKKKNEEPTDTQRRAMAEHRRLCTKHGDDAGWSRLFASIKRGGDSAPADPKNLDATMPSGKIAHNLQVLQDVLTDVAPRKKRRS